MERLRIRRPLSSKTVKKYVKIGGDKYAVHLVDKVVYVTDDKDYQLIYLIADCGLFLVLVGLNEFL